MWARLLNSRASARSAGARMQVQIAWGIAVGGRTASVSSDPAGTTSPEILFQPSSAVVVVFCLEGTWRVRGTHAQETATRARTPSKSSLFCVRRLAIRAAKFGSKATPLSGSREKHNDGILAPKNGEPDKDSLAFPIVPSPLRPQHSLLSP